MKKMIVSVVAGLTVMGSAFAVPSSGDRQKLCESKPFDFVWVEKTKACVPINPCVTANEKVRDAYCIKAAGAVTGETGAQAITYYTEHVLKQKVSSIKAIPTKVTTPTFALWTTDGGYYAVQFDMDGHRAGIKPQLEVACWAYGKQMYNYSQGSGWSESYIDEPMYGCLGVNSQTECNNMADFASVLVGELVEGEVEQLGQKVCWLKNLDGWQKQQS